MLGALKECLTLLRAGPVHRAAVQTLDAFGASPDNRAGEGAIAGRTTVVVA